MSLNNEAKAAIVAEHGRNKTDTGSPEVQVARTRRAEAAAT